VTDDWCDADEDLLDMARFEADLAGDREVHGFE
jgi:hypothetical protein